ncbi:MAG: RNA degradosome polyphosphate kinase [Actinomycetota bacterium]|nr:RNA degradosome polyphosphate kinase [Actinomycetota bacterium]
MLAAADDLGPDRFFNRELSWLDFNSRVLALAADDAVPLLERAKFCAIFSSNLDEFFMVRVAGLKDQVAAGVTSRTPDGRSPGRQLLEVREGVQRLVARQEQIFTDLMGHLADNGIRFCSWDELSLEDRKPLVEEFEERIFPVLTPLAVDPGHPFPYISNLSLSLAVVVRNPSDGGLRFARMKVPPLLPRFSVLPDGERVVPLEQIIAAHLDRLFPGMDVVGHHAFRVTRNADLTLEEEEADDLLAAVEIELRRRRFGRAVRLEISADMTDEVRRLLMRELDVDDDDVYVFDTPIDLTGLWSVVGIDRPDLKDPKWRPRTPTRLASRDADDVDPFAEIRRGDILVHHPYHSFTETTEALIRHAADDARVQAIKMTLYRTSGDSPIISALIRAAEQGKQVAALVELKARFDEKANIAWAKRLEEAGVHVTYGLVGLKTHTKTTLIIRDDGDKVRRYCHVGTGNYNSKTARIYEDIGLLTADTELGDDLIHLFNSLTGYARRVSYHRLLVAPEVLRPAIVELIRRERSAPEGERRITMKMNSLVDARMIDELYAASGDGVQIDLIVRGICCLRPGVPGLSENIRVRSIVGRFLEHSRIYKFANGNGVGEPAYYIGSADIMPRNLDRRVEALAPVLAENLRSRLDEILEINLADDVLAWGLGEDGSWTRLRPADGGEVDTHIELMRRTGQRSILQ